MKRLFTLISLTTILSLSTLTVERAQAAPHTLQGLDWRRFDAGLSEAKPASKAVMVQFYADWCHDCHRLEHDLISDSRLSRLLQDHFIPVRVNIQSRQTVRYQGEAISEEQLTRRLMIPGPPVLLILTAEGKQLGRLVGYRPPEQVQTFLAQMFNRSLQQKL